MGKRAPNGALARLLAESGMGEAQFARAVNQVAAESGMPLRHEQPSVSNWLAGTLPRKIVRPFVLEALARKLKRPVTAAEAGFPTPTEKPNTQAGNTVEELEALARSDMDPSRRGMLRAGLYSAALTIPGRSEAVSRVQAMRSGRLSRIGMGEVNVVIAMTRKIQELDDQFGTRRARPLAASFLVNTAVPCLRAEAHDTVRTALLSATSGLCHLVGYMAVDEGLHGLAQQYYVKALEFAGAADDGFAYCRTLRGMSVQATDLGHGAAALRLADAAAEAARGAQPARRAFFSGQQAHAAARTGDRHTALRHLAEAETAMNRADLGGAPFASYDPAALNYHVSQVKFELGDTAGSVASLRAANRGLHVGYQRTTIRRRFMLAERQLRLGHLDAACATWARALDDYPQVDSGRVDERVDAMKTLLRPYRENRTARDLYERAHAAVRGRRATVTA